MRKRTPFWRMLAVAATYVVVVQTLLLPLTVIASAGLHTEICSASSADGVSKPLAAANCACASGCGMQCCEPAAPSAPLSLTAANLTLAGLLLPAFSLDAVALVNERGPHNPRAPPV